MDTTRHYYSTEVVADERANNSGNVIREIQRKIRLRHASKEAELVNS